MKHLIKSVVSYALLGVLIGACMPLYVAWEDSMANRLPYWINVSPAVGVLVLSIPFGLFLGALTGLASAFATGRFAGARCLLAIAVPALLAVCLAAPEPRKGSLAWLWTGYAIFAIVATAMAILLAYMGYRRTRATSPGSSTLSTLDQPQSCTDEGEVPAEPQGKG